MREDIPIEEETNQNIKHNNYTSIECQWDPSIESADVRKRNPIDIVTLNGASLAALRNLHDCVYPREHYHKEKSKKHELDEAEVESNRLVHVWNLSIISIMIFECGFENLVATGTLLLQLLVVQPESRGLLMDHAHLQIGRNSESFEFKVLYGESGVLVGHTTVDWLWIK